MGSSLTLPIPYGISSFGWSVQTALANPLDRSSPAGLPEAPLLSPGRGGSSSFRVKCRQRRFFRLRC